MITKHVLTCINDGITHMDKKDVTHQWSVGEKYMLTIDDENDKTSLESDSGILHECLLGFPCILCSILFDFNIRPYQENQYRFYGDEKYTTKTGEY